MDSEKAPAGDAADALAEKESARRADLATQVRMRRAELRISSMGEVAKMAGMHKNTYRQLENGEGNITTRHLWRVADALGVHVTKLLGDPSPE